MPGNRLRLAALGQFGVRAEDEAGAADLADKVVPQLAQFAGSDIRKTEPLPLRILHAYIEVVVWEW